MGRALNMFESSTQRGRDLGLYQGSGTYSLITSLLDGPAGAGTRIACPTEGEHWSVLVPGMPAPHVFYRCSEASGNLVDSMGNGIPLVASGAVTYNQTVTGYTQPWVGVPTVAGAGFFAALGQLFDPGMPAFWVFDARITSTGGSRTTFTNGPNVLLQHTASGFGSLVCSGSTTVTGAVDYRSATVPFQYALYWEPADFIRGGPLYRLWTPRERLSVTAGGGPGGVLTFAGDGPKGPGGTVAAPAMAVARIGGWFGGAARACVNLTANRDGGRYVLERRGCTVVYGAL